MGHGYLQGPTHKLTDQRKAIKDTVTAITEFTGQAPRSWECPGLTETDETLDLLREHGIEFVADWVIDDLPREIDTPFGTITTTSYTVETNDIAIYALQQHGSSELLTRGIDQFDRLHQEGEHNARIMAISVHPYITGVPHRRTELRIVFISLDAKTILNGFAALYTNILMKLK